MVRYSSVRTVRPFTLPEAVSGGQRNPLTVPRAAGIGLFLITALGAIAAYLIGWDSPEIFFLLTGAMALALILIPLVVEGRYDPFSPWTLAVLLNVSVGFSLRNLYLTYGWPDATLIEGLFLRGRSIDYFVAPILMILGALSLLLLGYLLPLMRPVSPSPRSRRIVQWDERRLQIVLLAGAALSLLALALYVRQTGGFSLSRLSFKQSTVDYFFEIDLAQYRGNGYIRLLNRFSAVTYLLLLSHIAFSNRPLLLSDVVKLSGLFLLASLLPFYSSQRAEIIMLLVYSLAIWNYARRHISLRLLLILAAGGLIIFQVMTSIRHVSEQTLDLILSTISVREMLDPLVVNRGFLDMAKTAHIINQVPALLDVQYGRTLISWIFAPIPRELWPGKPLIQSGPLIGVYIFNQYGSGVPPGLLGELYWNFQAAGLYAGSLFTGLSLRWLYQWFRPFETRNRNLILVYVFWVLPFSFMLVSNGLTYAVTTTVPDTILLVGALTWITQTRNQIT